MGVNSQIERRPLPLVDAMLATRFTQDNSRVEVGVDEAGRGPMFGPVVAAAVVLPVDSADFPYKEMKDSKRFHSKKRIVAVAEKIREGAVAWSVAHRDSVFVDKHNIRVATHAAMHEAITSVLKQTAETAEPLLLIDGSDFTPLPWCGGGHVGFAPHVCIPKGDNKNASIAAASILAKVWRDSHIAELCVLDPTLDERYGLARNQGYGTAQHMAGLREHGLAPQHRRTFGLCAEIAAEEAVQTPSV